MQCGRRSRSSCAPPGSCPRAGSRSCSCGRRRRDRRSCRGARGTCRRSRGSRRASRSRATGSRPPRRTARRASSPRRSGSASSSPLGPSPGLRLFAVKVVSVVTRTRSAASPRVVWTTPPSSGPVVVELVVVLERDQPEVRVGRDHVARGHDLRDLRLELREHEAHRARRIEHEHDVDDLFALSGIGVCRRFRCRRHPGSRHRSRGRPQAARSAQGTRRRLARIAREYAGEAAGRAADDSS